MVGGKVWNLGDEAVWIWEQNKADGKVDSMAVRGDGNMAWLSVFG
jgi:hypothetical protein